MWFTLRYAGQVLPTSLIEVTSSSRSFMSLLVTSTPDGGRPAVGPPVAAPDASVAPALNTPVISTRLPMSCAAWPSPDPVSSYAVPGPEAPEDEDDCPLEALGIEELGAGDDGLGELGAGEGALEEPGADGFDEDEPGDVAAVEIVAFVSTNSLPMPTPVPATPPRPEACIFLNSDSRCTHPVTVTFWPAVALDCEAGG